jgi:hypothetical protein
MMALTTAPTIVAHLALVPIIQNLDQASARVMTAGRTGAKTGAMAMAERQMISILFVVIRQTLVKMVDIMSAIATRRQAFMIASLSGITDAGKG